MAGEFAVIGLGQFGMALAKNLADQGQSVLVIDNNMEHIEEIKGEVESAVCVDSTDENALYGLRIEKISCCVVAIGANSLQASILTTALLSQMGVPRIIGRAVNALHARILHAVGATEVVDPEQEMGLRLARRLSQPSIGEQLQLGSATLAEVETPQAFVGKNLIELELRKRFRVSVLAIRRGDEVHVNPHATDEIEAQDILVLIGQPEAVKKIGSLA
ncbi:potassium channel family protein [Bradymonas sediminis]|uniref:TrkA family potassium uptake protein n=1 Tax=Bradymonas sediminis TaxID=1548548 RepID=A0A2Z4FQI7_9DELT|nr:TrkA family potassium uptake protein [Bradymonas sediminis]AWV90904.1 TrkA family potassium uptake protein [Bradymonas sediminis]TDP75359.1 trk system potassium uptake protein TrkA [Bradymonas sediminis]